MVGTIAMIFDFISIYIKTLLVYLLLKKVATAASCVQLPVRASLLKKRATM